mgnify:CR=1 FL=1
MFNVYISVALNHECYKWAQYFDPGNVFLPLNGKVEIISLKDGCIFAQRTDCLTRKSN